MKKQSSAKKTASPKAGDTQKLLSRIFIIFILVACVLGFSLTFNFFSIFKTAEAGSAVVIDYTMYYDAGGNFPILTSSQIDLNKAYQTGFAEITGYTNQMLLTAGALQTEQIIPTQAYVYNEGMTEFALYDVELDALSAKTVGMHAGDAAEVIFPFSEQLVTNMTSVVYSMIGGNFSQTEVGMIVPMAIGYKADENSNETIQLKRPAVVIDKTDDELVLKYGYDKCIMTVQQIQ